MLTRTRSRSKLESSSKRSTPDAPLDDTKENVLPSPPSTPKRRRLRASPPPSNKQTLKTKENVAVVSTPAPAPTTKSTDTKPTTISSTKTKNNEDEKNNQYDTIYQAAKATFRRSAMPSRLVGRVQERTKMIKFWDEHVMTNKPGCLYISGSPGTGKTAMLNEIIRDFEDHDYSHNVRQVVVNCMSIREPKGIYTRLVTELKSPRTAFKNDLVKQAGELINGDNDTLTVVILDEIDQLKTKDQDVLYKIFEWASSSSSRLVLIGIANALDMTDRLLPRLRAKNCEPELLNFNPYQVAEISAIIKDRLYSLDPNSKPGSSPLPLMQPPAVELCARKVAAAMGDLRTALDVCRQAVELAETEHKRKSVLADQKQPNTTTEIVKVSIGHVMKVLQTVFGSPVVQKLKQLGLQQKVVICVLMTMSCSSSSSHKKEHITLGRFREEYTTLCSKSDGMIKPVSSTELTDVLSIIETSGIITIGKHKEERLRRLTLNIQESEVRQMAKDVALLNTWLETILPSK
ncbi:cell division control protein Cdc6 [Lichtheimia hyalospora FSU 10163]|nr:cell division control protein Cdc6 [Lichtheimia hyalospora FSU 10163]